MRSRTLVLIALAVGLIVAAPGRSEENDEKQLKENLGATGWTLATEQTAKLDAASATPKAYPYWHQAGFAERNPPPVG